MCLCSPANAQLNQCPNTTPGFTAGGNVFGRLSSQWDQYFGAKVDAVNGVLCNPTIVGLRQKQRLAIGWDAALDPGAVGSENIIATIDEASTISSIIGTVSTPVGAAATILVYKAPSETPCSDGAPVHSGSFDANGIAAKNQILTLTITTLNVGDRLCLVTTNGSNWTAGVGVGGLTVRITTP